METNSIVVFVIMLTAYGCVCQTSQLTNITTTPTNVISSTATPNSTIQLYLDEDDMNVGSMKDAGLLDVAMMSNMTESTMKYLEMYDEQSSMPDHDSMSVMEMTIDVSDDPMLTLVGSENVETMDQSALIAMDIPAATCLPYDQVIELPNHKPNVLLSPSCIVIKQCGGCCGEGQTCRPTATTDVLVKVMKYWQDGKTYHTQKMVDEVLVKEHVSCHCECTVQPEHCSSAIHYYDDWDCACKCNSDLLRNCPSYMTYNTDVCECQCVSESTCDHANGFAFNRNTCRCERVPFS